MLSSGYLIEFQKTQAHQHTGRNKQIHSGFLPPLCLSHTHFSRGKKAVISAVAQQTSFVLEQSGALRLCLKEQD